MSALPPNGSTCKILFTHAKNLYDPNSVGSSNPYAIAFFGPDSANAKKPDVKTKAANDGRNPTWNHQGTMTYKGELNLIIQLMDKDTFSKDDFIGEANLIVKDIVSGFNGDVQLYRRSNKGKAGMVNIKIEWPGLQQQQQQQPMYQPQMMQQQPMMQQPMQGMMYQQQPMMQQPVQGMVMQQPMMQPVQGMMQQQQPVQGMMYQQQPVQGAMYQQPMQAYPPQGPYYG
eukprot:GEMP01067583.1.p2 GENE.GEMP01067583.1~~GEMP01067583.1.p2  ORF type:complete len:228 (+),score=64.58 GEMP01067583.1:75-758(+)